MQLAVLFIVFVIFAAATIDVPTQISFGIFSGNGILTGWCSIVSWFFVFVCSAIGRSPIKVLTSYVVFVLYGASSLSWAPELKDGAQQVVLQAGFVGLVLVVSRCGRNADYARIIDWCLLAAPLATTTIYAASVLWYGPGTDSVLNARVFALFALFAVAQLAARWAHGSRSALAGAIFVCGIILMSLSRGAFLGALLMFPLSQLRGNSLKGVLRTGLYTTAAGLSLWVCIFFFEPLQERFFQGDLTVGYGGFSINGSGRSGVWAALIATDPLSHPVGIGAGGSRYFLRRFPQLGLEHPHNDYLRVIIEYGLLGSAVWLFSMVSLVKAIWRRWGESRGIVRDGQYACAGFVSLIACLVVMSTDNLMVYSFVQFPLACMIGLALAQIQPLPILMKLTEAEIEEGDSRPWAASGGARERRLWS